MQTVLAVVLMVLGNHPELLGIKSLLDAWVLQHFFYEWPSLTTQPLGEWGIEARLIECEEVIWENTSVRLLEKSLGIRE
jgi:hypothetical protein